MELFDTVYDGKFVSFVFYKKSVMVNATEMAKVWPNKRINDFLSNQNTKDFISACLNNGNSRYLNAEKEEDLITSKQKTGTWMHRVLALKFAAWLDPYFELWVFSTIDKMLFDHYRRLEESLKESAQRKRDIEKIRLGLRRNEEYLRLEQLELEERQASYARTKGNKMRMSLYRDELDEEE